MDRYIAIDSGKHATKVATYNVEDKTITKFCFHTRMSEGYFEDDSIESGTFIVELGGHVYKIGKGARNKAALETSKTSEIHKACTLSAIAMCVGDGDTVHVAVGIPVTEFVNVLNRNEYRDFILPTEPVTVKMKTKNETPPITKTFTIETRLVCPESGGVLYLNPEKYELSTTAVLDIGSLNVNGTYWEGFDMNPDYNFTGELGSSILISGLAQKLSASFSRCNESLINEILKQPSENRCLPKTTGEIAKQSKEVIHTYLIEHVNKIKEKCNTANWAMDYMTVVFVGGTSKLLESELKECFGNDIIIADSPSYANVEGFLAKLCARKLRIMLYDTETEANVNEIPNNIPSEPIVPIPQKRKA